jgi:hypothetical protein
MLDLTMFFPLMKTPKLEGFCDLIYEGPNNWENRIQKSVYAILRAVHETQPEFCEH